MPQRRIFDTICIFVYLAISHSFFEAKPKQTIHKNGNDSDNGNGNDSDNGNGNGNDSDNGSGNDSGSGT